MGDESTLGSLQAWILSHGLQAPDLSHFTHLLCLSPSARSHLFFFFWPSKVLDCERETGQQRLASNHCSPSQTPYREDASGILSERKRTAALASTSRRVIGLAYVRLACTWLLVSSVPHLGPLVGGRPLHD